MSRDERFSSCGKYTQYTSHDGTLCGIYKAPVDKLGPCGRWLRHKLLDAILVGTPVLVAIQKYRTPRRDKLMHILSFLGTEDFYTPVIILLSWVLDARLGRLFTVLMAMGFYTASLGKVAFSLPRPPTPPVQILESAADWALPSLHSILGVVLPWYIWIYAYVHYHLTPMGLVTLFCVIAVWSFSVMFSRVYLGVHSPADIVSGGIIGVTLLSFFVQVDDLMDHFFGYGQNVVLQSFVYIVILLALHPRSEPETLSYGDTCCLAGVAFGAITARARTSSYPMICSALLEQRHHAGLGLLSICGIVLARLLLGFPLVIVLKTLIKALVKTTVQSVSQLINYPFYSYCDQAKQRQLCKHFTHEYKLPPIYNLEKQLNDSGTQRKQDKESENEDLPDETSFEERPFNVDIPIKFLTYSAVTWMALDLCPHMFYHFNLTA